MPGPAEAGVGGVRGTAGEKAAAAGLSAVGGAALGSLDGAWSEAEADVGAVYHPSSSFWGAGASAGRGCETVRTVIGTPAGVPNPAIWAVALVGGTGVGVGEVVVVGLGVEVAAACCSRASSSGVGVAQREAIVR